MTIPTVFCITCGDGIGLEWAGDGEPICEPCGVEKERLERLAYGR